jgi:hypothetical protein
MKRLILITVLILTANSAKSQVISGSAVLSGRVRTDSTSLTIYDKNEGTVYIDVAIDRTGKVTGARIHGEGTDITSNQSMIRAVVLAKQLTFTPGTYYEKFEHALVKFTYVREDWEEKEEE